MRLYRCENGQYPDNLQSLVPKYSPKVPVDPFDSKPIGYRKLEKGFKVWGVGKRGIGGCVVTLFGGRSSKGFELSSKCGQSDE